MHGRANRKETLKAIEYLHVCASFWETHLADKLFVFVYGKEPYRFAVVRFGRESFAHLTGAKPREKRFENSQGKRKISKQDFFILARDGCLELGDFEISAFDFKNKLEVMAKAISDLNLSEESMGDYQKGSIKSFKSGDLAAVLGNHGRCLVLDRYSPRNSFFPLSLGTYDISLFSPNPSLIRAVFSRCEKQKNRFDPDRPIFENSLDKHLLPRHLFSFSF